MINKGYEPTFISEYDDVIFTKKNFRLFSAGDPAVMELIENYHDEWNCINGFGADDDNQIIVAEIPAPDKI